MSTKTVPWYIRIALEEQLECLRNEVKWHYSKIEKAEKKIEEYQKMLEGEEDN